MSKKSNSLDGEMISIYKTNIENSSQIQLLKKELDTLLGEENWNFDLDDCDRILRVDTQNNISKLVIEKLNTMGFDCEEIH